MSERHANPPDLRTDWWQTHLVPIHGHRVMILNQSARVFVPFAERVELWKDADPRGWRPRPAPSPEDHRRFLDEVRDEFRQRWAKHKPGETALKALEELAELLARERIAAVLVRMPEGPLMRSLYTEEMAAPALHTFAAISRKHGFPLVQARDWFGEEKFRDSYHLHEQGAHEFSLRLMRAIAETTSAKMRTRPGETQRAERR